MQQPDLNCERDEYPPIAFWQGQDIHDQYIRMIPSKQNGGAGQLFGLDICSYRTIRGLALPPATTRRVPQEDRVVHGPGRDTSIYAVRVTTTLRTLSLRFDRYPNQPDFGLTANPCWPSTLVDDPGFALLVSDPWYHDYPQRRVIASLYSNAPPLAYTLNNPPRAGYEKRIPRPLEMNLISDGADGAPPNEPSMPRANEAEPTTVDANPAPTVASTAATVGGGGLSALGASPKPTRGFE